jgi:death-on-curing protein
VARRLYLTVAEVLEMHGQLVAEFGGSRILRDRGALESAAGRPQGGYYQDVVDEAAALMESLANNHPFLDGNKRISFAASDTFLRMNGYYQDVLAQPAHDWMTGFMARGEFCFAIIRSWIAENLRKLPDA